MGSVGRICAGGAWGRSWNFLLGRVLSRCPHDAHERRIWFFAFIWLSVAISRLLTLRATLWPQLGTFDWFVLTVLLVAPILPLWRHLRHVREMTEEVSATGFQLVIGGYLPLWFGFTMVERVLGR